MTEEIYEGYVAHPENKEGGSGWCICFIRGEDAAKVAEQAQYFTDRGYRFYGSPFVYQGKIHLLMFEPEVARRRRAERSYEATKDEAWRKLEQEPAFILRLLEWLQGR